MRGPSCTWEDDHRLNIVARSLGLGPVLFPDDGLVYGADLDLIRAEMSSRRPRHVALIVLEARPAGSRRLCSFSVASGFERLPRGDIGGN